jgi:hypothetical protein
MVEMPGSEVDVPRLLLAAHPDGKMQLDLAGSAVRVDSMNPEVWAIGIVKSRLSLNRVIDSLIILALDSRYSLLPRILLPYQPAMVFQTDDGRWLNYQGVDLPREVLAMIRVVRVRLRIEFTDFIVTLESCLREDKDVCRPLKPEDPMFDASTPLLEGPRIPERLLQAIQ